MALEQLEPSHRDHVEEILADWAIERPDVDVSAQGVVGRVLRLSRLFERGLATAFARYHINGGEFDVLATLRRVGGEEGLSASALASRCMLSSAAMTNRLDRLETTGLVRRRADSADGRVVRISLTDTGRRLIDEAFPEHAQNQERMLSMLSGDERRTLARLLARVLHAWETAPDAPGSPGTLRSGSTPAVPADRSGGPATASVE
jgi:DNA-binding MarR family transcriptional regulator